MKWCFTKSSNKRQTKSRQSLYNGCIWSVSHTSWRILLGKSTQEDCPPGVKERGYAYGEKKILFLLYSHTTTTFTYLLAPHIKIFCNPSWVSYNSGQSWVYLPAVSTSSHKFRAQPHGTASTSDANHKSRLSPVLTTDRLHITFPTIPSLGFITCWSGSQNSGKHLI